MGDGVFCALWALIFCYYPSSSGIASCVAGTVMWFDVALLCSSRVSFELGCESDIATKYFYFWGIDIVIRSGDSKCLLEFDTQSIPFSHPGRYVSANYCTHSFLQQYRLTDFSSCSWYHSVALSPPKGEFWMSCITTITTYRNVKHWKTSDWNKGYEKHNSHFL